MKLSQNTEQLLLRFFKSLELCQTLFLESHIGYVIARRNDGKFFVVNNAFVEMTGYSRKELLKLHYRDVVPKESVPWIRNVIMTKLENESATDVFDSRIVRKTGGVTWVQSRIYRIDDEYVLVKEIDITKAKVTEAELIRSLNLNKKELPSTITSTERSIARLVASGMSSKEIAHHVNLAPRTIDNHRSSVRRKLNVSNALALREALQSYKI